MSTIPEIETPLPSRWGTAAAAALAVALVFAGGWLAGQVFELEPYEYLAGAVFALGAGLLALLLFGPSWLVISIFLIKMFTGHQFRSMAVVELIGIEWHPREAFLILLLAHFAVKLVFGQLKLKPDLIHYFFYLYAFFFALIAATGVWYQPNITEILKEIRFPAFLLCYLVFVTTGLNRHTLRYYVGLMAAATILIALGSTLFFFYTFLTGNVINVQNIYGEYVQRQIGPLLLQSIRPNGHMFFEVGVVLLVSMLLCPAVHLTRKLIYLPLLALLLFAIAITMMRTAYVALFFSLAMLLFLSLPRNLQVIGVFGIIAALAAVALAFGLQLYEWLLQNLPEVGVSLRGRFVEIAGAWDAFLKHPLMGSGMGSSFEGMGFVAGETKVVYTRASYQTVHNVWMYFLFKGGMVGTMFVLLGLGGIFARGYITVDKLTDMRNRFFLRAMLAAYAGQLLASLAMPRLTYPEGHVFVAMMAAVFFAMGQSEETETDLGNRDSHLEEAVIPRHLSRNTHEQ